MVGWYGNPCVNCIARKTAVLSQLSFDFYVNFCRSFSENAECMVEVRAQVMEWDENCGGLGGWIPKESGGISTVRIYRLLCEAPHTPQSAAAAEPPQTSGQSSVPETKPSSTSSAQTAQAEPNAKYDYWCVAVRITDQKVGFMNVHISSSKNAQRWCTCLIGIHG